MSNMMQKKMQQKLAEDLVRKTHFNKFEIESLLHRFRQTAKQGKLDRVKFRDILHCSFFMTDDIILDRVFKVFDKDNDSFISMEEWVKGLSTFLRGTFEEQTQFCFDVYDLNSDGFISREEMFTLLKSSMVKHQGDEDPDEGTKDLVETAMKKLDTDGDHRVSFKDFQAAVCEDDLLLESLGMCLPSPSGVEMFNRQAFSRDDKNSEEHGDQWGNWDPYQDIFRRIQEEEKTSSRKNQQQHQSVQARE